MTTINTFLTYSRKTIQVVHENVLVWWTGPRWDRLRPGLTFQLGRPNCKLVQVKENHLLALTHTSDLMHWENSDFICSSDLLHLSIQLKAQESNNVS
jgi:hypothetical protein